MLPEIGTFAIILALCFAFTQCLLPLFFHDKKNQIPHLHLSLTLGQFIFLIGAMLCLIGCFLTSDFSVIFVREHSNQALPILYRIGAAWGGHEGSLLLWCLILSGWTAAFTLMSFLTKNILSDSRKNITLIVMTLGLISTGFISFLLFTSNPFKRNFPSELISGDDLTPILQDPGLIFHPPMLYMGYVGFAIAFAFAIAALVQGKFDPKWARACRPWVIMPWSFLSCGIVLGSWWTYRELGWGGWWFWDPVENASLLPWLSATALLHSLIVSEKQNSFYGWTLLLAIITFALSLIGTFLVRSGVLVSVHAFASDPTRGLFLLIYLAFLIGGAFTLYSLRIKYFYQTPRFQLFSRETFLLINSVIMISAVTTILLGTLYPIILDALNLEKISVGEPYFNMVFMPIMLPLLLLMGMVPHVHWNQQTIKTTFQKLRLNVIVSLSIAVFAPLLLGFPFHGLTTVGIFLAVWIICGTIQYAYRVFQSQQKTTINYWSMIIAHLGIAIFVLGVAINKSYSEERQLRMHPGETATLAGYQLNLRDLTDYRGPNYQAITAHFAVQKNNNKPQFLAAEQRVYSHQQTLSKTGILTNVWRDLYVALGSSLGNDNWSIRIYYKPFVRWIWFGGFMLLVGGLLSILGYWQKHRATNA
jgi:cytochrome c-type biogenesis protein CcmF